MQFIIGVSDTVRFALGSSYTLHFRFISRVMAEKNFPVDGNFLYHGVITDPISFLFVPVYLWAG